MEQGAWPDHACNVAGRQVAIEIAHTRRNDASVLAAYSGPARPEVPRGQFGSAVAVVSMTERSVVRAPPRQVHCGWYGKNAGFQKIIKRMTPSTVEQSNDRAYIWVSALHFR